MFWEEEIASSKALRVYELGGKAGGQVSNTQKWEQRRPVRWVMQEHGEELGVYSQGSWKPQRTWSRIL